LICEKVRNDSQCNTILDDSCTYIYSFPEGSYGLCVEKTTEEIECDDIKRNSQCEVGGEIISLLDKCGIYEDGSGNSGCETKCSMINDETICGRGRSRDCFWLMNDVSNSLTTQCLNKV
jgi:hypothetical protein